MEKMKRRQSRAESLTVYTFNFVSSCNTLTHTRLYYFNEKIQIIVGDDHNQQADVYSR